MKNVNQQAVLAQNQTFLKKAYNSALFPCMLSILSGCINIIADGIIVGQKIGSGGLAAINLCIPIYLILCIMGSFFVSGTAIPASQAIGNNDTETAQRYYGSALTTCLISSGLAAIAGIFLSGPISAILCADESIRPMVYDYTIVTLIGALPKILIYVPFWYLRLDGKNKTVTVMMAVMGIGNILLDLVYLFFLNMGVFGAALASVVSTAAACIVGLVGQHCGKTSFRLALSMPEKKQWKTIVGAGSPAAVNNLMQAVKLLFVNWLLAAYGGSDALAVFSVVNGITAFSETITVGVPQAGSAMLGVSHGERDIKSVRILMKIEFVSGLIFCTVFGAAITAGADIIRTAYGLDIPMFIPMLCLAVSLYPALFNSMLSSFYSVSSHPMLSNMIITLRSSVFIALGILIFCMIGSVPWLFMPFAEIMTIAVWFFVSGILYKRSDKLSRFLLEDTTLEKSGKVINFSVEGDAGDICNASAKITEFCEDNGMNIKQTVRISLAIEELLTIISDKNGKQTPNFDMRVFSYQDMIGIRIKYDGIDFDPLEVKEDDDRYMGVTMLKKLVEETMYKRVLGLNTLLIII